MQKFLLFLITLSAFGCNYSLSKIPNSATGGAGSIEALPPGTIVGYSVISSIIKNRCLECHSSPGAGGIDLDTYENLVSNQSLVRADIEDDSMPKNRPKLTPKEKEVIFTWMDNGSPRTVSSTPPNTPSDPSAPPAPPLPPTPPLPPVPPSPDVVFVGYEKVRAEVLAPRCIECHSRAPNPNGKVPLATYEETIVSLVKIKNSIVSGEMPRGAPLTKDQKDLLLLWIANGAPLEEIPAPPVPPVPPTDNGPGGPDVSFITYEMVHKEVIKKSCLECHSADDDNRKEGNAGGINLESYENVVAVLGSVEFEIKNNSMPKDKPLKERQKKLILEWIAKGAPRTR
jgi:uncharacterized membrane protein